MQLHKKASRGKYGFLIKTLTTVSFIALLIFILIMLVDKIDFPAPNQKIEKNISNENLKIVK
tara:strand:+ start:26 stop:211 length:186 start_codon:yes stop_codon:yes gene_type:complete